MLQVFAKQRLNCCPKTKFLTSSFISEAVMRNNQLSNRLFYQIKKEGNKKYLKILEEIYKEVTVVTFLFRLLSVPPLQAELQFGRI